MLVAAATEFSSGWSDSVDNSHTAADRWLLYAAAAVLGWVVGPSRGRAAALLGGAAAGVLGVAGWVLVKMLAGHGAELCLSTRLNDPLGYVNGQAGYLLVGVWPCLALAECPRVRSATAGLPALTGRAAPAGRAALAGAGMAGIVALMGLGLETQSRSWSLAVIATTLLLLALVPGRRRRAAAVLLVAVGLAAIYSPISSVWRHPSPLSGLPSAENARQAAVVILIAALAAGVVWAAATSALGRLPPPGSRSRSRVSTLTSAGLAAAGIALVVAIGLNAGAVGHRIHSQYEAFV